MKNQRLLISDIGFILLLLSLVCLLILPPYWHLANRDTVVGVLLIAVMGSFILLVFKKKWELVVAIILALPVLLYNWGGYSRSDGNAYLISTISNLFFYLFITTELVRFIKNQKRVNFNVISAAICAFFILGLLWAYIYLAIEISTPGALLQSSTISATEAFSQLFYFSFVTMTTLGYGDIVPSTVIAQRWVLLQAITGQFYLAIIIARLVSLYRVE